MSNSKLKMAYAIQCHTNSEQVNRLIESLDDENIDFFIHVDQKSDILKNITVKDNVFILRKRIDVQWGGFSQVEATLELLKAIKCKDEEYAYVHLISGQDFPIKSKDDIQQFFRETGGSQFIEYVDFPSNFLNRVEVYYPKFFFGRGGKIKKIIRGVYNRGVMKTFFKRRTNYLPTLYYGSSWFSITSDCVDYILNFIDKNNEFYNFFKNSFCSDEMFFQTIILNSRFKEKVVNDNLRYIDWYKKGLASPKTLLLEDYSKLINTNKLFARKFDSRIDSQIILRLENSFIKKEKQEIV
ncbi:beta-1,6-N-acetylglucosaminyltransferase [Peribacillus simplex]|uniref:Peptide O-xylosyltransferase n=1 Tax=Peribacillus simplex TaxID=1478 RepID=A0A8B5XWG4_9BACI|nr:beta-1,6-N-acetylglucosaminyltransferase [Peribacillus simplex]TVX79122.1 beta-1,6-N-acetylglucosaminyltransferase [Peribacillus simplex]